MSSINNSNNFNNGLAMGSWPIKGPLNVIISSNNFINSNLMELVYLI